jgi:hypothetical protein
MTYFDSFYFNQYTARVKLNTTLSQLEIVINHTNGHRKMIFPFSDLRSVVIGDTSATFVRYKREANKAFFEPWE